MAELAAAGLIDSASVPLLRLGQIQTWGAALERRSAWLVVRAAPGSLHVLLAAILLVLFARTGVSVAQGVSGLMSNDRLLRLVAKHAQAEVNYWIVAQCAGGVENT